MTTRRTEKIARVIKESVSHTLLTRLSDPRIQGLVTITEVEVTPDLRQAVVYLSVVGVEPAARQLTLTAIRHAAGVIQTALGRTLTSRYVPHLRFEADQKVTKTLETLRLIEQAREEWDKPSEPSRENADGPADPKDSEDEKQ